MPLKFVRNDITRMECDAIVNAANNSLLGGGGVDGAIHAAAGPGLLQECRTLGGCDTGKAKITKGYRLPAKYVIHTVGPVWRDGRHGEPGLLHSCYRESLALAKEYGCESIAFPLISAGVYGYPKDQALKVAVDEISDFLLKNDMTAYIVIYGKTEFNIGKKLVSDIEEYIDECYIEEHPDRREQQAYAAGIAASAALPPKPEKKRGIFGRKAKDRPEAEYNRIPEEAVLYDLPLMESSAVTGGSLDDALKTIDESFSQMLLRKIDEKGMTDAECYKKANIDRKLFSKIRSDVNYRPSKPTALAFAIALELPMPELQDMLMKAGYALSHSSKSDIIIEYFVKKGQYDIFTINEALFAFDQVLL